jgi:hypothetical protein
MAISKSLEKLKLPDSQTLPQLLSQTPSGWDPGICTELAWLPGKSNIYALGHLTEAVTHEKMGHYKLQERIGPNVIRTWFGTLKVDSLKKYLHSVKI